MKFKVNMDTKPTEAGFKDARREVFQRLATGLRAAGEKDALPSARALSPSVSGALRSSLVVKASATGGRGNTYGLRAAYLTTNLRGKKGRYVGLQEYGGTVKNVIRPRKAKALYINGRFAAQVTSARTYKGQGFMRRGVAKALPGMERTINDEIMKAFEGFNK